jgi:hypothetical protein
MPFCPACDSGESVYLGTLGTREHYSCRDCGMQYSQVADDEEDTGEEMDGDMADCDDSDDGYALASAGFGTDEDYGGFGIED